MLSRTEPTPTIQPARTPWRKPSPSKPSPPPIISAARCWRGGTASASCRGGAAGRGADPYAVWLSEIMLQQTTVASVVGYFKIHGALAQRRGAGGRSAGRRARRLGGARLLARARNLHACAKNRRRRHGGRFPREEARLLELPGVGPYTAAAIAAIAFDAALRRAPTAMSSASWRGCSPWRSRCRARGRPSPPMREAFWRASRPGDFAQALMDLGATVCAPRGPDCGRCPLETACAARKTGTQLNFPVKPAKKARPHRRGAAFVLLCGESVLLRGRPAKGLLGGMSEFPSTPLSADLEPEGGPSTRRSPRRGARSRARCVMYSRIFRWN